MRELVEGQTCLNNRGTWVVLLHRENKLKESRNGDHIARWLVALKSKNPMTESTYHHG